MTHRLWIALALLFGLSACQTPPLGGPTYDTADNNRFIPSNYAAADALVAQLQSVLPAGSPVIATTVVNVDALETSSTLGRAVTEQVASRLTQKGYKMIELRVRNNVYIKQNQGEFVLTREIRELAESQNAQAIVVGTYAEASDMVYITLKAIQPQTNVVLAVSDYALPRDAGVRAMLKSNTGRTSSF